MSQSNKIIRAGRRMAKKVVSLPATLACPFSTTYPPGHYYSPIPSMEEILAHEDSIFKEGDMAAGGVDLKEKAQIALLDELCRFYAELPFTGEPTPKFRYYYNNSFFSHSDAIILYSIMRHFRPRRIVEVGSGYSSAVMLDTRDAFAPGKTSFVFIDPFPGRLRGLLRKDDEQQCRVLEKTVQSVAAEEFARLEADDILFIDSSHVVKVGSDLAVVMFDILPRLKPGVIIHFHDVLWPFEYPKEWFAMGRAWNEAYFLRAFLQYNSEFEILYFNSFMGKRHAGLLRQKMPLCLNNTGGSLWLRRKPGGRG